MGNSIFKYEKDYQDVNDMISDVNMYRKVGSDAILNRIINHKLKYAFTIASKSNIKVCRLQNNDDFIQTLAIAITKAVKKVPLAAAGNLNAYIYNYVKDSTRDYVQKEVLAVNLSDQIYRLISKINVLTYNHPLASKEEIKKMVTCSDRAFEAAWESRNYSVVSCDSQIDESGKTYEDLIESHYETPEDIYNKSAIRQELYKVMLDKGINDKYIVIYSKYKGLFGMNQMSVNEIAKSYNVSHAYISKVIKKVELQLGIRE